MKSKVTFYHAGCPVCVEAESKMVHVIDKNQYDVEVVHFAEQPERISEAEALGVRSVPAMILDDAVFHINFGAALADLTTDR